MKTKETLKTIEKKTARTLIITLSTMVISLFGIFLLLTSNNAQRGYELQQEQIKNENLKSKSSSLSTKITKTTAFSFLEKSEKLKEMNETEEKIYITPEDNKIN